MSKAKLVTSHLRLNGTLQGNYYINNNNNNNNNNNKNNNNNNKGNISVEDI
jgi:hypothetical protein